MGHGRPISRRGLLTLSVGATIASSAARAERKSAKATPSKEHKQTTEKTGKTGKTGMPYGTIGDRKISRLILGANTPGAHSRDLLYVSQLGRAYNTKARMLDMYALAESQGINTVLQGNRGLIKEYNRTRGGHLRTIQPVNITKNDTRRTITRTLTAAMKNDVAALFYIMGDRGDYLARAKRMDVVGTAMDVAGLLGITLGLGGHSLHVVTECEKNGITPDFYLKTFHHDKYWSATPKEHREPFCWYNNRGGNSYSGKTGDHNRFHDNIWCLDAAKTTEAMKKVKVPWIAFKVLAAGAISPTSGFTFSFQNGADFVAVGMCDFHIKQNVRILKGLFAKGPKRERPWIS